ncbi:hypothetical protein HJ01_01589 [Flavobacterium frigoris PS1]|uniref:Uncharacterized protein n=1 Tax=Flavobacterium frigoris (strain PS1) TaxID=1086011 RepID=H7FQS3_FLAFP|nr:hypothetical protein HJ01_01589 [Flavobacterium frigoris PS1]
MSSSNRKKQKKINSRAPLRASHTALIGDFLFNYFKETNH